ncbi:hypothetical protein B0H13DRAFT_2541232 [Mycena leptocephala]|nr:hypothetical protein B0H13DRAFT_2541232 [Mycena leptocephala]
MRPVASARVMHARAMPHSETVQHSFPSDDFRHASLSFITYPSPSHISSPMFASLDGVASRMDTTHSFHPIAPFPRSPQPNISRSPTTFVAYSSASRISSPSCASLAGAALHLEGTRPVPPIAPYTYSPPIVAHSFSSFLIILYTTFHFLDVHSSFRLLVPILHAFNFIFALIFFARFVVLAHIIVILAFIIVGVHANGSSSCFARLTPTEKALTPLVSERLAKFNSDERLISYDGSPLPMTRNPGGVAAHLFSLHRSPAQSN